MHPTPPSVQCTQASQTALCKTTVLKQTKRNKIKLSHTVKISVHGNTFVLGVCWSAGDPELKGNMAESWSRVQSCALSLFHPLAFNLDLGLGTLTSYSQVQEAWRFLQLLPLPASSSTVFYRKVSALNTHTCSSLPPMGPAVNLSRLPTGSGDSFPGSHFPPSPAFLSLGPPSPSPLKVLLFLPCSQCGHSSVLASIPSFLDLETRQFGSK